MNEFIIYHFSVQVVLPSIANSFVYYLVEWGKCIHEI